VKAPRRRVLFRRARPARHLARTNRVQRVVGRTIRIADAALSLMRCWPNGVPGLRMKATRLPSGDHVGLLS